jgi:hypothetical protein
LNQKGEKKKERRRRGHIFKTNISNFRRSETKGEWLGRGEKQKRESEKKEKKRRGEVERKRSEE